MPQPDPARASEVEVHFHEARQGTVVDLEHRSGWSVTAIGPSRAVTDAADIARLQRIGLDPWAPGVREHFIRISPQLLNGRWLGAGHQAFELGGAA